MELVNIEELIKKYLEARTSLEEEKVLEKYFTEEKVAIHLKEYQYLFSYLKKGKNETYTKNIKLTPNVSKKMNLQWISIAASFALIVSVYVGNEYYKKQKLEEQYKQVNYALNLLSSHFKKGEQAVVKLYAYENTVKKILK